MAKVFDTEEAKKGKTYHSKAYHRFFEGYAEMQEIDPRTLRPVIKRVYIGPYFRIDPKNSSLFRKLFFSLIYLLSWIFLIVGSTRNISLNTEAFTRFLPAACILALMYLAFPMFYVLSVPKEMEIRHFRESHENLIKSALIAGALFFLCFIIDLIVTLASSLTASAFTLFCYLFSSLLLLGMAFLESRTPYEKLPPKHTPPDKARVIQAYRPD